MVSFLLFLIIFAPISNVETSNKTIISIYAITTSFSVGESIQKGHEIAIDVINNNQSILPAFHLNLTVLDSGSDSTKALVHALAISYEEGYESNHDNDTNYVIPILLGCDWSTLSTVTAPALAAFLWAQLSASSTSVLLSNKPSFSHFYRTIPSDTLQAASIIHLCQIFDWSKIGIIHVNDNYGVYLSVAISELGTAESIEVKSIAFERNKNGSYKNAASAMKKTGVYIIVLITHGDYDIVRLSEALEKYQMFSYPYYYIATDGWLDDRVIHKITANERSKLQKYEGIIGTLPWQPMALNDEFYAKHNLTEIYQTAGAAYKEIEHLYRSKYDNSTDPMGTRLIYAYDSIIAISKVLQTLDERFDLLEMFRNNLLSADLLDSISYLVENELHFNSVSGSVSFDSFGDRYDGMYSFGFIREDGSIGYFGYSYLKQDDDNDLFTAVVPNDTAARFHANVDENLIVWPNAFRSKNIIPQSSSFSAPVLTTIDETLFIVMSTFASLGILSILCYIAWLFVSCGYQNRTNFKLNMIIYIGSIMAYCNVIISGLDEREVKDSTLDILCNVRIWILCISFTLIFCPIFAKTHKLSRIFTELLIMKSIPDNFALWRVLIAFCIDLVILIIFTSVSPSERVLKNGLLVDVDELQKMQYLYGTCEMIDSSVHIAFVIVMGGWKIMELIFGVYVSIIVWRIGFKAQVMIMAVIVVAYCVDILLILFGPMHDPNFRYMVATVTTIATVNVIILKKWMVRTWMRLDMKYNKNTKYSEQSIKMSDESKMRELLRIRLKEIARTERWANELRTINRSSHKYEKLNTDQPEGDD